LLYSRKRTQFDFPFLHTCTIYDCNTKMGKLDGKVALITGGSDGIGLSIAELFVAEGAHVFITGRRQSALDEAIKKINMNNKLTAIQADVSNMADISKVYEQIKQEKGHLDILVANAALAVFVPLGSITEQHFDETFNTSVKGVLFNVQAALPIFTDGGSIIILGSVAGCKGTPAFSVYSATKAALRSFARSWSVDLNNRKIRVNTLSPGPINTAAHREQTEEIKNFIKSKPLMNRIGEPEEVAKAALFLASHEDSSYITGIELFVDGGTAQI
jgi:NAD(P)-dependent dehydrogenase (short-subunit alcohol dehydrogenase family)